MSVGVCTRVCTRLCWGRGQPFVPILYLVPMQGLPAVTSARAVLAPRQVPARGCVFWGNTGPPQPVCPLFPAPLQSLPVFNSTGLIW